jgi:RHS repeat-associated protein
VKNKLVICLILLGVFINSSYAQSCGCTTVNQDFTETVTVCGNLTVSSWSGTCVNECTGESFTGTGDTKADAIQDCISQASTTGSRIDNFTYNHIHDAVDYKSAITGIDGCVSCGSSSPLKSAQVSIGLKRLHRFRNMTEPSSLGPGIFFSYDVSLSLFADDEGNPLAEIFDPTHDYKWHIFWKNKKKAYVDPKLDQLKRLELLDANMVKIENWKDAAYARMINLSNSTQLYEIFTIDESQRSGRLINFTNTQGYSYSISYAYEVADTEASADMLWQKSSITDSNNRSLTFHYLPEQRKSRWVVSQVDLPNGSSINYNYEDAIDGALISVDYPDGTQSTFNYVGDEETNSARIDYFEAGAQGTHRKKSAYLSNNVSHIADQVQNNGLKLFNQASLLVKEITNGEGETSWKGYNLYQNRRMIFEGGNSMKYIAAKFVNYLHNWEVDEENSSISGHSESSHAGGISTKGKSPKLQSDDGKVVKYLYSRDGSIIRAEYSDGTYERFTRDQFQNDIRHEDRLGRVTYKDYDQNTGNILKTRTGYQITTAGNQNLSGVEVGGFNYQYYEEDFSETDTFANFTPVTIAHCNDITRSLGEISRNLGFHFTGNLNIEIPGEYTFKVKAAKQAFFSLNGSTIISNTTDELDEIELAVTLTAGQHSVDFKYMQVTGNNKFDLTFKGPDTLEQFLNVNDDVVTHAVMEAEKIEIQTTDYAEYIYEYYTVGHANENLLRYEYDANGNRTEYIYDEDNLLVEVLEPNDDGSGYHTSKKFTYDSAKRLASSEDAVGRVTAYGYDNRDRQILTTYNDTSTEETIYGTAVDANLVVDRKDRNGNWTHFDYDDAGRKEKTTTAAGSPEAVETTYTYLNGTDNVETQTTAGEKTEYTYDYRNRLIATTTFPDANSTLTTSKTLVDNKTFCRTDAYGRNTYSYYRESDSALVRTVKGLLPSFTLADYNAVITLSRDTDPNADYLITDFELDVEGQRTATIDPRGIRHETDYDSRGRTVFSVRDVGVDSLNQTTQQVYDANSNVLSSIDPMGNVTDMTYGSRNKLTSRTVAVDSPVEATESFTYYDDGRAHEHLDFNNQITRRVWHACCGRLQASIDQDGNYQVSNNDFYGNVTHTAVVDASATISDYHNLPDTGILSETTTRFDSRHRPIAKTVWLQPLGDVDPNDVPIATDPAQGLTTHYLYYDETTGHSELAPIIAELAADGISFDANNDGSATITINPAGETQVSIQDGVGRTIAQGAYHKDDFANGTYTLVTWSTVVHDSVTPAGLLETKQISALGFVNKSRSDGAGRTLEVEDTLGNVSTRSYDANSNIVASRDANGVGQDCSFDNLSRDLTCTDTEGSSVSKIFDLNNNILSSTDSKAQITESAYDARNRKESTTDRLEGTTDFTYDDNSNLLTISDALDKVTTYGYDDRNLQTSVTYADGKSTQCSYDALGRKDICTDQLGEKVDYDYDLAGRMTQRLYKLSDDSIESTDIFTYDAASRPLTATKGRYGNVVTYTYDEIGRRKTETLNDGVTSFTTTCAYDADNREVSCTYPNGDIVVKGYTDRNQLESLSFNAASIADFTYDNGMREGTRTFGNSLVATKAYNLDNTLESINLAGEDDLGFSYTYDANKNVLSETSNGTVMDDYSWTAGFDAADRVTSWNRTTGAVSSQSWNLDLIGNWDDVTTNNITESRTHNDVHELIDIDGQAATYDDKGNLLTVSGKTLTWDLDNHLTSVDLTNFTYDAIGRRVSKGSTLFISHGQRVIEEYTKSAGSYSLERSYVHGTYVDDILAKVEAGTTPVIHYYHCDRQYNVRGLTDASGNIDEFYAYTVYGKQTVMDGLGVDIGATAHNNNYGFTGRYLDSETNLWYFRARYFSDESGRFISRDPLGYVDGFGLYAGYFAQRFSMDPSGQYIKVKATMKGNPFRQSTNGYFGSRKDFLEQLRNSGRYNGTPPKNWKPTLILEQVVVGALNAGISIVSNSILNAVQNIQKKREIQMAGVSGEYRKLDSSHAIGSVTTKFQKIDNSNTQHIKAFLGGIPYLGNDPITSQSMGAVKLIFLIDCCKKKGRYVAVPIVDASFENAYFKATAKGADHANASAWKDFSDEFVIKSFCTNGKVQ